MRKWLSFLAHSADDTIKPLVYRFAPYLVLSLFDDPAMLALAFC